MPRRNPKPETSPPRGRPLPRRLATAAGDVLRLFAGEGATLAVQVLLLTVALLALAAAPAGEDTPGAASAERLLRLNAREMIGPPLSATEDMAQADAAETEKLTGLGALFSLRVWRNRVLFIWPSLYDTTLLLLAGMVGAVVFACLLVIPALRARSPGARAALGMLDELGLILCCVPVFVAGFLIRLKAPPDNRLLYYALAALSLGIGNLTLAEMVQMLRAQIREEIGRPYFDLIDARGFSLWQKLKHRALPYARAVLSRAPQPGERVGSPASRRSRARRRAGAGCQRCSACRSFARSTHLFAPPLSPGLGLAYGEHTHACALPR